MKKTKKHVLSIFAALAALFLVASTASAIDLAPWNAFDLDNYTRLYRDGDPIDITPGSEEPAADGDMSRAFITFNGIGATSCGFPSVPCPQGGDSPEYWSGGDGGVYLHGWEDNVVISHITDGPDGDLDGNPDTQILFFEHATNDPDSPLYWEFAVYETGISKAELEFGDGYLIEGADNFNTIKTNLETHASTTDFIRGRFAESLYYDDIDNVNRLAVAAILVQNFPAVGGSWINQVNLPYNLGVNAFVDIDPDWGIGGSFFENAYGSTVAWGFNPFPNSDPYDIAIQGVTLNTEIGGGIVTKTGEDWIISDDEVRGGTVNPIPEPATMLLLGTGLVGVAGAARRRNRKK